MKFDEPSGITAYDAGSGNNDAELRNGAAWTGGRFGGALRFDGSNDYAYIDTTSNLDIYQSITIAAWINPASVTKKQDIICKHWQSSNTGYEFGITSAGELMFRINPTESSVAERISSGAGLQANVWQHVAVVYDGASIRFYRDGVLVSTVAAGGRLYPATSDLFIGIYESATSSQFSGSLDELRIYDRGLTDSEIKKLYSLTIGTTTTTSTPSTSTTSTSTTRPTTTTSTSTTRITTTSSSTSTIRPTTTSSTTTSTTSTTIPSSCRVGQGYTFASIGTYTASSSSGVASISRSGQYTFYETPHNYMNSMNCAWSGTYTCPTGTSIRFYLRAQTEEGYDFFNFRNSAGTVYEVMSGDRGAAYAWTNTYSQRTASFNFVSEEDTAFWGVDLYQIECLTTTTTTTTTTRQTTPTTRTTTTTIDGDCFGAEDCNPTGDPIGGGSGYSDIITTGKYIVSSESELRNALASAKSGEVVFIPNGVTIDISRKAAFVVPGGVTVASNRGSGGAAGALIKKNKPSGGGISSWAWGDPAFLCGGNNVRITGLQMEGEMFPSTEVAVVPEEEYLTGINQHELNGLEVDNCELRGFAWANVLVTKGTAYVHHNKIHNSLARHEGYGVDVDGSTVLIEANIFDNNRHSICWGGDGHSSYEARYNIHLGHGTGIGFAHFDLHSGNAAGDAFRIHHNTFEMSEEWNIGIQGPFNGIAYINHNQFNTVIGCSGAMFSRAPDEDVIVEKNYCNGIYQPGEDFVE
jgi:hypothetical protein